MAQYASRFATDLGMPPKLRVRKFASTHDQWNPHAREFQDAGSAEADGGEAQEFLRAAKARTLEALEQAVADALAAFTAGNAQAGYRYCGHAL